MQDKATNLNEIVSIYYQLTIGKYDRRALLSIVAWNNINLWEYIIQDL